MPTYPKEKAKKTADGTMVLVTRSDGSTMLVPLSEESIAASDKAYIDSERARVKPPTDAIELAIGQPTVTPMTREAMVTRMRQAGQGVSDVADQGYAERMAREQALRGQIAASGQRTSDALDQAPRQPTPFTDVRRGISEQLIQQNPSQSDILSEADLRLADELRRRNMGI